MHDNSAAAALLSPTACTSWPESFGTPPPPAPHASFAIQPAPQDSSATGALGKPFRGAAGHEQGGSNGACRVSLRWSSSCVSRLQHVIVGKCLKLSVLENVFHSSIVANSLHHSKRSLGVSGSSMTQLVSVSVGPSGATLVFLA